MGEDQTVLQLWRACYAGNTDRVQELIEDDADYCQRDRNGETVLHMAARSDNSDVLNLLLDHLSPDVQNHNHQTPLHLAASKGHISVVKLLLQSDCQMNIKTKYSEMTALHLACQHNKTQVVAALLEGGAICNEPDTIGKPPDFYATDADIHKLFKDHAKYCTHHNDTTPQPLPDTPEDSDSDDKEVSDEEEEPENRHGGRKGRRSSERSKKMWKSAVRSQKKIKINHGLGFSEEHRRRMEMNVFDRLMGNKKK